MTATRSSSTSTLSTTSTEARSEELDRQTTDLEKAATNSQIGYPVEPTKSTASRASNGLQHTLSRTLSRIRTSDTLDPGPPPDQGIAAWSQALLGHLVVFNTWGFINSFGVFQTYYVNTLRIGSPSEVAWIGTIQVFVLFSLGMFAGRLLDAGFFRITFIVGSVIYLFGMFMLSLCTAYWQVFLAQGICVGIGFGLVFVPSLALVSTYFSKHRAIAIGTTAAGSATGGIVFPAIAVAMLPTAGFGWTIRTMAFVQLLGAVLCAVFLKPRIPPRKAGPVIEWSAFKDMPYMLYLTCGFFFFWSVYIGFYYIGTFARNTLGLSQSDSISLLIAMNGVGLPARLIINYVAGKYTGPINILLPFIVITGLLAYCWSAVHSVSGLWVFACIYGLSAAALQSLWPVVLTSLTTDPKKAGVRAGMGFCFVGFAVLTGPPIGGALIERLDGRFLGCQIFAGSSMIVSACILGLTRWAVLRRDGIGWKWKVKV